MVHQGLQYDERPISALHTGIRIRAPVIVNVAQLALLLVPTVAGLWWKEAYDGLTEQLACLGLQLVSTQGQPQSILFPDVRSI